MYTHVCSLSCLGTIDSPTTHVYTCPFTFLARYNWFPYHTCIHMSVHFPRSVQLIPLPYMYTHVCSLSWLGTIDTPTTHVYTCLFTFLARYNWFSYHTCIHISVHFPGSVQLIPLPYMYTHVCSLSWLGTINSPTTHVYTCPFTFLARYNWYTYHTCIHMSVHFPGSVHTRQ
jgi:hypothetical protein